MLQTKSNQLEFCDSHIVGFKLMVYAFGSEAQWIMCLYANCDLRNNIEWKKIYLNYTLFYAIN